MVTCFECDNDRSKIDHRSLNSPINRFRFGSRFTALVSITLSTLTVLVTTIDAQWEGMGDVGSARYEPALLPPCPTIRVLSYSN